VLFSSNSIIWMARLEASLILLLLVQSEFRSYELFRVPYIFSLTTLLPMFFEN
jgi:hypothetical protein